MKSYVITKVEITEVFPAFGDAVEMVRVNGEPVDCGDANSNRYYSLPTDRYIVPLLRVAVPVRSALRPVDSHDSFERFRLGIDHHGVPDTIVAAFREVVQTLSKSESLRTENVKLKEKLASTEELAERHRRHANELQDEVINRGVRNRSLIEDLRASRDEADASNQAAAFWRVGAIMSIAALIGLLAGYVFL